MKWLEIFSSGGIFDQLLKDDGFFLVVEDQQLPVGEKPNEIGFLVLDQLQIKRLFKIKENDSLYKIYDVRNDNRLKAHKIPREYLIRIDEASRIDALKELNNQAEEKINELRKKPPSTKTGRIYAFWMHQYVNSALALNILTTSK